jgi:hypothetical protein
MSAPSESQQQAVLDLEGRLCDFCIKIIECLAKPDQEGDIPEFEARGQSTCQFCDEVIKMPRRAIPGPEVLEPNGSLRLMVNRWPSSSQNDQEKYSRASVWWYGGDYNVERPGEMDLALWADSGTFEFFSPCTSNNLLTNDLDDPASERFASEPPLLNPSMEEVCRLASGWLKQCKTSHEICRFTSRPKLPSRVLQLSGSSDVPTVRLIETKGIEGGDYCALSHCWGPPADTSPPRTTHENYEQHLAGILLERLPKTFRDTIALAWGLGIIYVWIDSLCIIQNDEEDWRLEAEVMGDVYRNATLVIGAAGAKDSTEGLFITERPCERVYRAPYILDGVKKGSFYLALQPQGLGGPTLGPLGSRAWAYQERYLAQRAVHFMPHQMFWGCEEQALLETSDEYMMGCNGKEPWLYVLKSYSEKKLTYTRDRVYALHGIIDEMQKDRQDQFIFGSAVWERNLEEQILWRQDQPGQEIETLDFPTWSWASTGGTKDWVLKYEMEDDIQCLNTSLKINDTQSLVAAGHISNSTTSFQRMTPAMLSSCRSLTVEDALLRSSTEDENCPAYLIQNDPAEERIMGFAVFDREPCPAAKCSFVAKRTRSDNDDNIDKMHETAEMELRPDLDGDTNSSDPTSSAAIKEGNAIVDKAITNSSRANESNVKSLEEKIVRVQ